MWRNTRSHIHLQKYPATCLTLQHRHAMQAKAGGPINNKSPPPITMDNWLQRRNLFFWKILVDLLPRSHWWIQFLVRFGLQSCDPNGIRRPQVTVLLRALLRCAAGVLLSCLWVNVGPACPQNAEIKLDLTESSTTPHIVCFFAGQQFFHLVLVWFPFSLLWLFSNVFSFYFELTFDCRSLYCRYFWKVCISLVPSNTFLSKAIWLACWTEAASPHLLLMTT